MSESDYTINSDGNRPTTVQSPGDTQHNLVLDEERYSDDADHQFQTEEKQKQPARNHYVLPGDEDEEDYEDRDAREHAGNNT